LIGKYEPELHPIFKETDLRVKMKGSSELIHSDINLFYGKLFQIVEMMPIDDGIAFHILWIKQKHIDSVYG